MNFVVLSYDRTTVRQKENKWFRLEIEISTKKQLYFLPICYYVVVVTRPPKNRKVGVNLDFLLGFLGYYLGARLQPLYSAENVVVVVAVARAAVGQ